MNPDQKKTESHESDDLRISTHELVEYLRKIYVEVFGRTDRLRFNLNDPQHLYSVCLHGTILELASAVLVLLEKNECSAVPALVRNLLEAYVDLVNLCQCSKYVKRMQSSFLREQTRVLKTTASGTTNPYLEALAKIDELNKRRQSVEEDLQGLERQSLGPLTVRERFDLAGLTQTYESVYALLCMHSHNNLNILERRHLEKVSDTEYRVSYFQPWDVNDLMPYIDTIAGVIVDSLRKLGKLLTVQSELRFDEIETALSDLRSKY